MTIYILFLWLVTSAHPQVFGAFYNAGDCQRAAEIANAGRQPLAYCKETHLASMR